MPIITLTTDFGLSDGYVAAMRGVILGLAPGTTVVDVSHLIAPGAIAQAAYVLGTVLPCFPGDTIHVVVVDPGVGTARRPIAVRSAAGVFVGPDNGVLTPALADGQPAGMAAHEAGVSVIHLTEQRYWRSEVSATFHGRDIFAPVAAHLALGVPLARLGVPIDDALVLAASEPQPLPDGSMLAHVLHVDHFGNLVTTLGPRWLETVGRHRVLRVEVAERHIPVHRTYHDVAEGECTAYIGSSGYLELAVRGGSAASALDATVGTAVRVVLTPGERHA